MDYNYVRMRNAKRKGDKEQEQYYSGLYQKGISNEDNTKGLSAVILLLCAVSVVLGIFIIYTLIASNSAINAIA